MRPRVKVCGVTRKEDAALAAELGACAVGFIFWPGSPRFIDPYRARVIVQALPPCVSPIGVFVDQPADYVSGVAGLLSLGAVQLHGSETIEAFAGLGHRLIKAVPVNEGFRVDALSALPPHVTVLLDAHDPVRRGGTGRTIDWSLAARAAAARPIVLSGGLTPGNVREAVEQVRPYMIDVSSGVESSPRVKDAGKLRAFFDALGPAPSPGSGE
jgi:phosphoribosylanthranilate isomerase